jgi:hypothetical protein
MKLERVDRAVDISGWGTAQVVRVSLSGTHPSSCDWSCDWREDTEDARDAVSSVVANGVNAPLTLAPTNCCACVTNVILPSGVV